MKRGHYMYKIIKLGIVAMTLLTVSEVNNMNVSHAAKDTSKPVLKKVKTNKKTAYPNDEIILEAAVSDTGSGVNKVTMNYSLPVSKKKFSITFNRKNASLYQGKINVSQLSEKGTWNPISVTVTDKAKNSNTYYNKYNNIYKKKTNLKDFSPLLLSVKAITNSNVIVDKVTNVSTFITGTAKSDSIVYATVNNSIIGKAKTINGKYKIKIPTQKVGTKITIYSDFKSVLSKKITVLVNPYHEKINYYDPATVTRIKTGQIQTLDGLTLDEDVSTYRSVTEYPDDDDSSNNNKIFYRHEFDDYNNSANSFKMKNSSLGDSVIGISDFLDNPLKQPKITRLSHNIMDLENGEFKRKYMLNLYGKPNTEDSISADVGYYGNAIVDFYDNVTFIYRDTQFSDGYYLSDVIYLGKDIKSDMERWKTYVRNNIENHLEMVNNYPITQELWDESN